MDGPGGAVLVRRRHRNEADVDNSQSHQQTTNRNAFIANANASANADVHASASANFTVTERRNGEHPQHQDPQHSKLYKQLKAASIILHTASILILIIGFLLRSHLHNGSDCDMTYSHREFIPVDTTPLHHPIYKLYQFHDSRQVRQAVPNNQTHAVLYVPGHWGSHTQCRSVGAHGIQLTRAHEPHYKVQRLNKMMLMMKNQQQQPQQDDASTTTTTTTTTREDFIYETYCIDFAEQGGGMHASLLTAQRDYVDQLVLHYFQGRAMTIVGHSLGGIVATKTNNQITILTLATPHAAFPYSLDESIHHFYRLPSNANRMVVSISGGFKDELIPPALCELIVGSNTATTSMTLQTSRIMRKHHKSGLPLLGMDHKAIVWCHEVLSYVRTVIFQLSHGDPRQTLRDMARNAPAYQSTVQQQKKEYGEHYGSWALLSVECAMLYNAELLLGLFAMNCGLHHGNNRVLLLPRMRMQMQKMLMIPIAAGCLAACWSNHNVSLRGIIILSYVASTVMAVVAMVANLLPSSRRQSFVLVVGFFMMAFGYRSIILIQGQRHQQHPGDGSASFISEMVMMSSVVMWTVSIFHLGESLDTLIVVSLPCLVAGKAMTYYKWSFQQELHGLDDSMLRFLVMVVIPMGIRLVLRQHYHCLHHHHGIIFVRIMVVIAVASGGMLQVGGGYRVGYLIGAMSMVDALFTLIGGMRKQK